MPIDTHTHLSLRFEQYEVADVLARASAAGVDGILMAGYCPMHYARTVELLTMFGTGGGTIPALAGSIGIHPHEADKFGDAEVKTFPDALERDDIVAVGETGLDFFRDYADRSNQEKVFRHQIQLAVDTGYPLIIHSRSAFERTMEILDDFELGENPGVFHCYGYGPDEMKAILNKGFYISFAGVLTYVKAVETQRTAKLIPEDRLLIETDCPFMVPRKARNRKVRRNEPAYVMETFEKMLELRNWDEKSARKMIISNTLACFPKLNRLESWNSLSANGEDVE